MYKLLIDGKLVDGASTLEVVNPATGKVLRHARALISANSMPQ
jgi:acyl-CoA reductase-like NAD-dependent aldehyde dehydrogenase